MSLDLRLELAHSIGNARAAWLEVEQLADELDIYDDKLDYAVELAATAIARAADRLACLILNPDLADPDEGDTELEQAPA